MMPTKCVDASPTPASPVSHSRACARSRAASRSALPTRWEQGCKDLSIDTSDRPGVYTRYPQPVHEEVVCETCSQE